MIVELTVENIALIEKAQLALGPGFTALTGETGAGKSLFVDAVELALGARADTDLVRSGSNRARVTLTFDLSSTPEIEAQLADLGAPIEDHLLYVQRELFAEGKSQVRIGGKLAPLSLLKEIGSRLVDLHGQHDHQSLLRSESHLGFVDAWIGEPVDVLKSNLLVQLTELRSVTRKLSSLRKGAREREQRIDLLSYQGSEIRSFGPVAGELDLLTTEEVRLRNAEVLSQTVFQAVELISDSEINALDLLNSSVSALDSASRVDSSLEDLIESLRIQAVSMQESVRDLRAYVASIEFDPGRHNEVLERIDGYKKLFRKYGDTEVDLIHTLQRIELELSEITESSESAEELESAESQLSEQVATTCQELSDLRKERCKEFCNLVAEKLNALGMENAGFEIDFRLQEPEESGADWVEFLFSANQGEPVKPLAKIASGGEISRVMLAIKSVLANNAGVPTLIFDEVDVGLGGRAATMVAKLLDQLSAHCQILVISHLPQIAGKATTHFAIRKGAFGDRVLTEIQALEASERVLELARMIGGETITEAASAHARELLDWR